MTVVINLEPVNQIHGKISTILMQLRKLMNNYVQQPGWSNQLKICCNELYALEQSIQHVLYIKENFLWTKINNPASHDVEIIDKSKCYHCGENCTSDSIHLENKYFCCDGCKLVYEILSENNLCTYYDLNNNPGVVQKIKIREDKFAFLDDEGIQQKLVQFTDGKQTHLTLYLPK